MITKSKYILSIPLVSVVLVGCLLVTRNTIITPLHACSIRLELLPIYAHNSPLFLAT